MSDHGHSVDIFAADQGGLGLLADGTDLFDLSHMTTPEPTPAWIAGAATGAGLPGHESLASDLFAAESEVHGEHPAYLQVAGLDQAPLLFPAVHPASATPAGDMLHDQAPAAQTDHLAASHGGADHATDHGQSLSLADILADAADDLASFHTAAGGTAGGSHVPMGSGFFTPFNPVAPLGGFTELAVIDHPILNGHGH